MKNKYIGTAHNVQPLPHALRGNTGLGGTNYETSMGDEHFLACVARDWSRIKQSAVLRGGDMPLRETGMLSLLLSEPNRAGNSARFDLKPLGELNQADGRSLWTIQRTWEPVRYDMEFGAHEITYCEIKGDAVQKPRKVIDQVKISKVYTSEELILDKKMVHCEDMSWQEYIAKEMAEHMRKYAQGFAALIGKVVAEGGFVGAHPASGGEVGKIIDLPVLKADGETSNPIGLTILQMYAEKHNTYGTPMYLIGGDFLKIVDTYAKYKQAGCSTCHQINDAAVNADIQSMFVYDQAFQRRMRDQNGQHDNKLAWGYVPGALTLVTRAVNKGDFVENHENDKRYTMIDPWFGLEHDVVWKQQCGKTYRYSVQYEIQYDVFGYPPCLTADPCFKNVNDIVMFRLTCEDTKLCDLTIPDCSLIDVPVQELETECLPHNLAVCVTPCKTLFSSSLQNKCYFASNQNRIRVADNIVINGTPLGLNSEFSVGTTEALDELADNINALIKPMGGSIVSYAPGAVTGVDFVFDLPATVYSFTINSGADEVVTFTKECKEVVCYKNLSTPKTGQTINLVTWTMPDGTTISGAPGSVVTLDGYTGTVDSFCVNVELAGDEGSDVTLVTSDTGGCTGALTGTNYICADTDGPVVTPGEGVVYRGTWRDCTTITRAMYGGNALTPAAPYTEWIWGETTGTSQNIYDAGSLVDLYTQILVNAGHTDANVDIPFYDPTMTRSIDIVVSGLNETPDEAISFHSSVCPADLALMKDGAPPPSLKLWGVVSKGASQPDAPGSIRVGVISGPTQNGWGVFAVCAESQPPNSVSGTVWEEVTNTDAIAAAIGGTITRDVPDPDCNATGAGAGETQGGGRRTAAKAKKTSTRKRKK